MYQGLHFTCKICLGWYFLHVKFVSHHTTHSENGGINFPQPRTLSWESSANCQLLKHQEDYFFVVALNYSARQTFINYSWRALIGIFLQIIIYLVYNMMSEKILTFKYRNTKLLQVLWGCISVDVDVWAAAAAVWGLCWEAHSPRCWWFMSWTTYSLNMVITGVNLSQYNMWI